MGKRKIEIALQPPSKRKSTWRKRSRGLIKKVHELVVLCGAEATMLITSEDGKIENYCSLTDRQSHNEMYKQLDAEREAKKAKNKELVDEVIQKVVPSKPAEEEVIQKDVITPKNVPKTRKAVAKGITPVVEGIRKVAGHVHLGNGLATPPGAIPLGSIAEVTQGRVCAREEAYLGNGLAIPPGAIPLGSIAEVSQGQGIHDVDHEVQGRQDNQVIQNGHLPAEYGSYSIPGIHELLPGGQGHQVIQNNRISPDYGLYAAPYGSLVQQYHFNEAQHALKHELQNYTHTYTQVPLLNTQAPLSNEYNGDYNQFDWDNLPYCVPTSTSVYAGNNFSEFINTYA